MATTATTCDAMSNISTLHGAIGLTCSRRHAASFSSASTCSTDDFPALTKDDLPARDSLEFVRKTVAHKRELRNTTDGEDPPVLTPEDLPALSLRSVSAAMLLCQPISQSSMPLM